MGSESSALARLDCWIGKFQHLNRLGAFTLLSVALGFAIYWIVNTYLPEVREQQLEEIRGYKVLLAEQRELSEKSFSRFERILEEQRKEMTQSRLDFVIALRQQQEALDRNSRATADLTQEMREYRIMTAARSATTYRRETSAKETSAN